MKRKNALKVRRAEELVSNDAPVGQLIVQHVDGQQLEADISELPANDGFFWHVDRPIVILTPNLRSVTTQVVQHLGRLGFATEWISQDLREEVKVYQRGDSLVQVLNPKSGNSNHPAEDPEKKPRIRPLPKGLLRLRITDACSLVRKYEDEEKVEYEEVPLPGWLLDAVHTSGDWSPYVRRLKGLINAPTIRPDGSILQNPGYDEATELIYIEGECVYPRIPDSPTREDAQKAASQLLEVVSDFPFLEDSDRSAWLAMVLSLVGRPAIPGCVPMIIVTANRPGAGKTILVDIPVTISSGHGASRKIFPQYDNEMRKVITAIALEGVPAVLLDNLGGTLEGASLDAALTANSWTDRIVGRSRTTGDLPLRTVWIATGNNVRYGTDLTRRVLPIRLHTELENPEERADFKIRDLLGWVRLNRPRLVAAALTILRAYVVAGKPEQPGGHWGSYENWTDLIRGAIVWAGLADPLLTRVNLRAVDEMAYVKSLVEGLRELDPTGQGLTAKEIARTLNDPSNAKQFPLMREVAMTIARKHGVVDAKELGYRLRKMKGVIAAGWRIEGREAHGGVTKWRAAQVHVDDHRLGVDAEAHGEPVIEPETVGLETTE